MLSEKFIRSKFGIKSKRLQFPDEETRVRIAGIEPEEGAEAALLTTVEGLAPVAYCVTGARALHNACNLGVMLHMVGGILGMVALTFTEVMFKETRFVKSIGLVAAAIAILAVNFILMRNPSTRYLSGLFDPNDIPPEQLSPQKKQQMDADVRGEEPTAAVEFTAEAPQEEQPAVSSGSDES
jgi:hypothetical protein